MTARPGTLYLNYAGARGSAAWIKESGTDTTGWVPIGHSTGPTTARPAAPVSGTQYFDITLGKPIWWRGTAWVDATGAVA